MSKSKHRKAGSHSGEEGRSAIKILIVEDQQVVALDVQNYLEELGYGVAAIASTGKEALELAKKTKPDLALMDIVLKGSIDGIETARRINSLHGIPSVFLTAYADREKIERAKSAHPFGYILKPFQKDELKVAVEMAYHKFKSDQKILESERKIKRALEEREIMLKEIHHRVKNNMQLISSLLSLQATHLKDKAAADAFEESQNRIRSMMLIHENLYASKDFTNIDFSKYIDQLVRNLYATYRTSIQDIQMKIGVRGVLLNMNRGVPCGLIVNELVSNAFKHAFSKEKKKKKKNGISVLMSTVGRKIKLVVSDNGVGLPKSFDPMKPRSLGFQLVNMLVKQLDGTLNISRGRGTAFTIVF